MPVLVAIPGNTEKQGWPAATHYIVDPQAVLHVYEGEKQIASYKAWDSVTVQDALTLEQALDVDCDRCRLIRIGTRNPESRCLSHAPCS